MPIALWSTAATGARQLVVHDAFEDLTGGVSDCIYLRDGVASAFDGTLKQPQLQAIQEITEGTMYTRLAGLLEQGHLAGATYKLKYAAEGEAPAMACEGEVNFTMADIDRLSRQVPCICKLAPASQEFHMEDVSRAGGILSILGELERAGKIHAKPGTVAGVSIGESIAQNDIRGGGEVTDFAQQRSLAAPGNTRPFSRLVWRRSTGNRATSSPRGSTVSSPGRSRQRPKSLGRHDRQSLLTPRPHNGRSIMPTPSCVSI